MTANKKVKRLARERQDATGEKYMVALLHVNGECGRCEEIGPCEGCMEVPCRVCAPEGKVIQ